MPAETRKPSISISGLPSNMARPLENMKQSIEMITGARPGMKELVGLPNDASLFQISRTLTFDRSKLIRLSTRQAIQGIFLLY